jgi:phage shock protein A
VLVAEMLLDDRKRDDARDSAQRALKVNPNSLEARSLVAAIDVLEGKTTAFEAQVQQVLKTQPGLRRGLPRRRRSHGAQLPVR